MRLPVVTLVFSALAGGCYGEEPPLDSGIDARSDSPACTSPPPARSGGVWGVADLHAHPANHLAYNGTADGSEGFMWGVPGRVVETPGVVPVERVGACDAEAHSRRSTDQVTRATRNLLFSLLGDLANYPHAPGGHLDSVDPARDDFTAWPHARDLFHQQMHIEAMHRAWQGGLRLMFASVADNQIISAAFAAPAFPGEVHLDQSFDRASAERQLLYIQDVARRNADWMEIVTSPEQARDAIESGRLAIVLSLEMDALSESDVDYFYEAHGVRHVVPIHVADNDVGGTAAYNDFFGAGSALLSTLFGGDGRRYISVDGADDVAFRFGWLQEIRLGVANYLPTPLSSEQFGALGYEPLFLCTPAWDGVELSRGQINALGLINTRRVQHLMDLGVFVDVSHAGERSTEDMLQLAEAYGGAAGPYPLIASHGGVATRGSERGSERDLAFDQAVRIVASGGVLGLGTSGIEHHVATEEEAGTFGARLVGRWFGRPLLVSDPLGSDHYFDASTAMLRARTTRGEVPNVLVRADGRPESDDRAYVRVSYCAIDGRPETGVAEEVELVDPEQDGLWTASLRVGSPEQRVASLIVGIRDPQECRTADANVGWTVQRVRWDPDGDGGGGPIDLATFGDGIAMRADYNSAVVYQTSCHEDTPPVVALGTETERHIFRVSVRAGGDGARGATPLYAGTDVVVRLVDDNNPTRHATPWISMNHRATWGGGVLFRQYLVTDAAPDSIGVEVSVRPGDGARPDPFHAAEIVVEEVYDPVDGWAEYYAALRAALASACVEECRERPLRELPDCSEECDEVRFALGTDLNGYAPQFAISAHDLEYPLAYDGGSCISEPLRFGSTPLRFEMAPQSFATDDRALEPIDVGRGLASYGMLPELFALLQRRASSTVESVSGVPGALFGSAEETIQTWEQALSVSRGAR